MRIVERGKIRMCILIESALIYARISIRGSVPKWSNGSGCKPDVSDFAGSSPAWPTIL